MKTWLYTNALAVVSLIVGIAALFKDRLLLRLFGPHLTLHFDRRSELRMTPVYLTDSRTGAPLIDPATGAPVETLGLYLQLRVKNSGRSTAEMVEVLIKELWQRDGAESGYVRNLNFLPLSLKWTHTAKPFRERIPPDVERSCDLLHIFKLGVPPELTNVIAELDLEVLPATGSGRLGPGFYQLILVVAAGNARAQTVRVDLCIPDRWSDDVAGWIGQGLYLSGLEQGTA